jgi:hypothetical protein
MKVTSFAERRGGADAARALYEDLAPAAPPGPSAAARDPNRGR